VAHFSILINLNMFSIYIIKDFLNVWNSTKSQPYFGHVGYPNASTSKTQTSERTRS